MRGIKIPLQDFALKMQGGLKRMGGAYLRDTTVYLIFFFKLRELLRSKWTERNLSCRGGLKFSLRFPDSSKIECSLPSTASSKVCGASLSIS